MTKVIASGIVRLIRLATIVAFFPMGSSAEDTWCGNWWRDPGIGNWCRYCESSSGGSWMQCTGAHGEENSSWPNWPTGPQPTYCMQFPEAPQCQTPPPPEQATPCDSDQGPCPDTLTCPEGKVEVEGTCVDAIPVRIPSNSALSPARLPAPCMVSYDSVGDLVGKECCPGEEEAGIRRAIETIHRRLDNLRTAGTEILSEELMAKEVPVGATTICGNGQYFVQIHANLPPCIWNCTIFHEKTHARECVNLSLEQRANLSRREAETPAYMNELGCLIKLLKDAGLYP